MTSPDYSSDLRAKLSAVPKAHETPSQMRRAAASARFAHGVRHERAQVVKNLFRDGLSDAEIGRRLGISADDAREYRTRGAHYGR